MLVCRFFKRLSIPWSLLRLHLRMILLCQTHYSDQEYERDESDKLIVFQHGRFQRDEHGRVEKRLSGEVAFKLYDTYRISLRPDRPWRESGDSLLKLTSSRN